MRRTTWGNEWINMSEPRIPRELLPWANPESLGLDRWWLEGIGNLRVTTRSRRKKNQRQVEIECWLILNGGMRHSLTFQDTECSVWLFDHLTAIANAQEKIRVDHLRAINEEQEKICAAINDLSQGGGLI
jgi:hypothetical protein